jgi:hypothetical protein
MINKQVRHCSIEPCKHYLPKSTCIYSGAVPITPGAECKYGFPPQSNFQFNINQVGELEQLSQPTSFENPVKGLHIKLYSITDDSIPHPNKLKNY